LPTKTNRKFEYIEGQVRKVMTSKTASVDETTKKTIIRELLDSDLPPNDRNAFALEQEGLAFVAAGTATTARALESTFFYILSDPKVLSKLITELRAVKAPASEILSTRQLEQLPYLSATVQEALRAVPAVPSRFPRINRTSNMEYGKYILPPGTVIGMSNWDVLGDEKIFKNADKFVPERWLDLEARTSLQRYQVAFGKGSRNCVGQNLAMSEIFMVLGNVFRRYDMELYETTEKEITVVQDCFVPFAYPESKGVRVVMRNPKTETL
jgi:cytochrome P450